MKPLPPVLLSEEQFTSISAALRDRGWIVIPDFVPSHLWLALRARAMEIGGFNVAGIGRGDELHEDSRVRSDSIYWLDPEHPADKMWLGLMEELRQALNLRLFMGLFEFESHYARYDMGDFYQRHYDAFAGEGIRILSAVLYLNPDWLPEYGGELVLYSPETEQGLSLQPEGGTLVLFLSEEFAHEVLPAGRTRFSIAGWFRSNMSTAQRVDPPA